MHHKKRAFSLIELIVVVAIVGVLAAIAMPVYKDYRIRIKVNNALTLLHSHAQDILNTYDKTGSMPAYGDTVLATITNGPVDQIKAWTLSCNGLNCASLYATWKTGEIPGADAAGRLNLWIFPNYNNRGVHRMFCGTADVATIRFPAQYLPASCIANAANSGGFAAGFPPP